MASSIDLKNIQGDILAGFPKKAEAFYFFQIKDDVAAFRARLHALVPLITSNAAVTEGRKNIAEHKAKKHAHHLPVAFTNIAFSARGLQKLGVNAGDAGDEGFTNGMLPDAKALGDAGRAGGGADGTQAFDPAWLPEFKGGAIDGVILVAGDSARSVHHALDKALAALHHTVHQVFKISGNVRPGKEEGHEHFGFEDGISNPAVAGITESTEGPSVPPVEPGVILLGRAGDTVPRPSWALDGSFLAFRLLQQLVPEFSRFLAENAPDVGDPSVDTAALLGARLTGRWHSGAPVPLTPLRDDPALATRNDFTFAPGSQEQCPFAAHVRKMNPRGDVEDVVKGINPHRVLRRGIPYGPEVGAGEREASRTKEDRGLLFVCYQSNLSNGFQFLQKTWANNQDFPTDKSQQPGFDPLIGQVVDDTGNVGDRAMTGADPGNTAASLDLGLQTWVVPKGGEYLFVPSISVLRDVFSSAAAGGSKEL